MFKTTATLIAAAVAASGTLALPAAAADGRETVSVAVMHDDLDLATQDGQVTLQRRLNRAAKQVCRYPTNQTLLSTQNEARCYRQARRDVAVQFAEVMTDRVGRGG
ncbi:UrcA family protein [Croceibacterium mercuriale]|uniref:UrcA family protein n=1 Tax=Croceibacterium mercuriale TaxID=1572751 RepID=UPI0009DE9039|nr:UrcA family protein [Croceibacterium mercuriale]